MRLPCFLLLFVLGWPSLLFAHGIDLSIETSSATVLTLRYANGKPYANERYTLTRMGEKQPSASGLTDASGRIVFIAAPGETWQLKSHAVHGHGMVREIRIPDAPSAAPPATPSAAPPAAPPIAAAATGPSQESLALFGLSFILGGFGLYQLLARRRG